MDKLGFTFYPKDWWTSESYFELTPIQRYYYLECLFIMYSNDGMMKTQKTQFENRTRTQVKTEDWDIVVSKFIIDGNFYTHESVNKRLRKAIANRENGKKGGRPPKPKEPKKETQKNPPLESEREIEREIENKKKLNEIENKEINNKKFVSICLESEQWIEIICMQKKMKIENLKKSIIDFENHLIMQGDQKEYIEDFKSHFVNWLNAKPKEVKTALLAKRVIS